MNTRSLTESLYNKYGKYDLSNVDIKPNKNKLKSKKLHEDFDFDFKDDENKKLYNYFITTAENSDFEVVASGRNYISLQTYYDDYKLEVDIRVRDVNNEIKISFLSSVDLPSGDLYEYKYFDNLEAAIAWGEEIIPPRMLLLRRIKSLIDKSSVKDITSEELESLID